MAPTEMTSTGITGEAGAATAVFLQRLGELRPRLHRYCARMAGSVIDAEDIVQEACIKALQALENGAAVIELDAWLFRIAQNTALDFLRRRKRQTALETEAEWEPALDPALMTENRLEVTAGLHTFMRLPVLQRSCVILMDVLGYSLQEITTITESSLPAVKAALYRGRGNLRRLAAEPEDLPVPHLDRGEQVRLKSYIDNFNARDFDAVRELLADDVRLDLVSRLQKAGRKEVATYFENYTRLDDWHLELGLVEQRLAILAWAPDATGSSAPLYFILLDWATGKLRHIRDFRYARYAMADADWRRLP